MPPSSKRSRARRAEANNTIDMPDSSPSRPAKRRRKADQQPPAELDSEPIAEPIPELEPAKLPTDRSGLSMTDEELTSAVVATLAIPSHEVQATQEHSNEQHQLISSGGVTAYAKLAGKGWTYYVKRLKNTIGRPPEGSGAHPAPVATINTAGDSNSPEEDDDTVHIDLGPSKMVSRKHAQVFFNSDTEEWNIVVLGRNGIRINGRALRRGDVEALVSGQVIEIAGVEMMFVLPEANATFKVHRRYLERAGLIAKKEENEETPSAEASSSAMTSAQAQARGGLNGSQMPIAPAPPDYRRQGTPLNSHLMPPFQPGKSPAYAGSTMLMNSEDVDLSLDSNRHIKPTFSYAQLITQAILKSNNEKLTLSNIYSYITENFAYYRHQNPSGWQNSIRHNLSLNKSFMKLPRGTEEAGKGMKWVIVPESRDEMVRTCYKSGRGGHRGSPGSPGGANLARVAKSTTEPGSSRRTKKASPKSKSPRSKTNSPKGELTPYQESRLPPPLQEGTLDTGSPLPRHRRPQSNVLGISDNAPGSPPALSSSYLPDDGSAFVTPAPRKVHPHFGPASTAQRPSQVMLTSSPAPFWKFADINNTPMPMGAFDSSPVRPPRVVAPSSSPAPTHGHAGVSPSRTAATNRKEIEDIEEEEGGFDLTRGFQSIGAFHAAPSNGLAVGGALNTRS